MDDVLGLFHPVVAGWFVERLGRPTGIQTLAWREIAAGRHILASAPTGSGKTLAAFLWALDRLITGCWQGGTTRVLYVSPLKALNNDIRRNLLGPLAELGERFQKKGESFPDVRVMTRSGDTPPEERRGLYRHPPEILITTPESLNIMLTAAAGRFLFGGVRTVILDEIHALAGSKRGTHLITAVERLVLAAGEFQRIALSATVRPMEAVADFVGGAELLNASDPPRYRKRPVSILRSDDEKRFALSVERPEETFPEKPAEKEKDLWWWTLAAELKRIIRQNRSTLVFTRSRRAAEKMTRFLNEGEEEIIAYSHHGSIAREIRLEVEQRLKKGELRAIVATSSLELGIDIGELDEVVLVETPFSISSSIQRLGRAGHGVGETSRGRLYPTHGMDFLAAAVMAESVAEAAIEPIRPVECPLDVLAQVIVSMACTEPWNIDALYAFLKACHPYRRLTAVQYRLVLEMLAGRYADSRLKELQPRISLDRIDGTVMAKPGAPYLLYTSGGTIPDRGYYDMMVQNSRAKIGELDEEFVWERRIGDTFTLGTQIWRIQNITHNDVEVLPLHRSAGMVPFWRAEEADRDFHYSGRISSFLKGADGELSDTESFRQKLEGRHGMSRPAAQALLEFLQRQKKATAGKLPHRGRIVIEHYHDGSGRTDSRQTVLHTFWGGRLNRPFAMALSAAWEKKYLTPLQVFIGDDNLLLVLPNEVGVREAIRLVTPENLEELLRARLESSGFFGARFRENAARALLLPRASLHRRYPLWLARLRAKKLLETVARYPDFPVVLETWRECLQDAFDIEHLKLVLGELHGGLIELVEVENDEPSPFCDGLIWRQTNQYMYEDDTPESRRPSSLSRKILDEVLHASRLRPRMPVRLAEELESRLQRLKAGYAPSGPSELLDWLKERLLIPLAEWERLLAACRRDAADFPEALPAGIAGKIAFVTLRGGTTPHACALENLPLVRRLWNIEDAIDEKQPSLRRESAGAGEMDRAGFVAQWLSYYGPIGCSSVERLLGIGSDELAELLEELAGENCVIVDAILEGGDALEVCHIDNLERLLRMARQERRPAFKALPVDLLPLFIASQQGLAVPGETMDDLQARIEKLFGYAAPAALWEEAILPARMAPYRSAWMDGLLNSSPLFWLGSGREAVTFALEAEAGLFAAPSEKDIEKAGGLFPHEKGGYHLFDIARHASLNTQDATKLLWELAWKSVVANDSLETLRKGIQNGFAAAGADERGGVAAGLPMRRSARNRWAATRPMQGSWRIIDVSPLETGGIEAQELEKERARILLDRYGILFRELLDGEPPLLRWKRIFPALRLMELSGEILSGYFFEGIPGVQFMSFEAFRFLREGLDEDRLFWMNAKDPASLCGMGIEGLKGKLPRRLSSNHIVFQGGRLVMESLRSGRELRFHIPADHPRFYECLALFKVQLSRDFNPEKRIFIEKINGQPARNSEYRDALREFGFTAGYDGLELWKRY
ncbi:MAG: DEAD/DEAH box helicase [Deltaproteobacteria bacterium]|nr:DEAD/DEAH box helicase [Deltaproteobacteria bacterium]